MVPRHPSSRRKIVKLRTAILLVGACGFLAAAAGIGVRATYGARVSADEPQYLLTALSLAEDASLDISDEIEGERYRSFHEVTLDPQTEPLAGGREVSPHDPLLPLLLAFPVKVAGWVGAKLALALVNGALGALLVWIAARRFAVRPTTAALVAGIFVASAPLAVYGTQVYPELPAALMVALGLAAVTGDLRTKGILLTAAAVVALPWLSVKYAPVAAALALAAVWKLWRQRRRIAAAYLCGGLAVAGVAYLIAHLEWYGGITVYATGDHFSSTGELGVVGTEIDPIGRSRRLIGLLVDNRFGLAVWQPAFLLVLPAVGALTRVRPRDWSLLVGVALVGWLGATFVALTMQGWWWPGRQTVVVLPAVVLAIAWWAHQPAGRTVWVGAVGALGVVSFAWLVVEGLAGRLTWIVDFYDTENPYFWVATRVTPDYLEVTPRTWLLHAAWIVIAGGLLLLGRRGGSRSGSASGTRAGSGTGPRLRALDLAHAGTVVVPARSPSERGDRE
jgi:hypothetical protein